MVADFADVERAIGTDLDAEGIADVDRRRQSTVAGVLGFACAGDGVDGLGGEGGGEEDGESEDRKRGCESHGLEMLEEWLMDEIVKSQDSKRQGRDSHRGTEAQRGRERRMVEADCQGGGDGG